MDYAAAFNGTLDEVRIADAAPGAGTNLLIDEPAPGALAAAGALGLFALGRRRRA
jgi:MYXO-CTERM domain-containing protein